MDLELLGGTYAVTRLPRESEQPPLAAGPLAAAVRDRDALTLVVPEADTPAEGESVGGWRAFEVAGPLDLAMTGILASLAGPLRDAAVPVFVVSSHATDFVLVPEKRLPDAIAALEGAGHSVTEAVTGT